MLLKYREEIVGQRVFIISSRLFLFFLTFITIYGIGYNYFLSDGQLLPTSDLASEMLLTNTISRVGYLLTGHPSRFGFHHPGPFFYYINYGFEYLLQQMDFTRTQIWLIAGYFKHSAFLVIAAMCFVKLFYNTWRLLPAIWFILISIYCLNSCLIVPWAPYYTVTPYLAFILTLILMMRGEYRVLPLATALACILMHAYATMVSLTFPLIFFVFIYRMVRFKENILTSQYYRPVLSSIIIFCLFAVPMVWDLCVTNPSNLSLIIKAKQNFAYASHPHLLDMLRVMYHNWLGHTEDVPTFRWLASMSCMISLVFILGCVLQKISVEQRIRQAIIALLWTLFVAMILVIFSYKGTPMPLYDYTMSFLRGLRGLLIAVGLVGINDVLLAKKMSNRFGVDSTSVFWVGMMLCLIAVPLAKTPKMMAEQYVQTKGSRGDEATVFLNYLVNDYNTNKKPIMLSQATSDVWPMMTGLLLALYDKKIASCTVAFDPFFLIGYTPQEICQSLVKADWQIVHQNDCNKLGCVVQNDTYGLIKLGSVTPKEV